MPWRWLVLRGTRPEPTTTPVSRSVTFHSAMAQSVSMPNQMRFSVRFAGVVPVVQLVPYQGTLHSRQALALTMPSSPDGGAAGGGTSGCRPGWVGEPLHALKSTAAMRDARAIRNMGRILLKGGKTTVRL